MKLFSLSILVYFKVLYGLNLVKYKKLKEFRLNEEYFQILKEAKLIIPKPTQAIRLYSNDSSIQCPLEALVSQERSP